MSARTGLGIVETAALITLADFGGLPDAGHRKTTRLLTRLELDLGLGPRYAYLILQDLQANHRVHLPLLDVAGNWGSQGNDPAAEPQYTALRLSRIGALAVAAERGELGPIPLGIIEGSLYRGGPVPPFDPRRVVDALQQGLPEAGPPTMPTGGTVAGDINGLLAGRQTRLRLGCVVVDEPDRLVITHAPIGVSVDDIWQTLGGRGRSLRPHRQGDDDCDPAMTARRGEDPSVLFGVESVWDESTSQIGLRIVVHLSKGSDRAAARAWIDSVWPASIEVDCRLPAPMRKRLRDWAAGDGSGLAALAKELQ